MKVAILGGTGKMGGALAIALSKRHEIVIGSRDPARAQDAAKRIRGATGADYAGAAKQCEVAIFAVPFSALGEAVPLAGWLRDKLVISMINPIKRDGNTMAYPLEKGSAAEMLAAALPGSMVATAFNNIPDRAFRGGGHFQADILVAATSKEAYDKTAELVESVPGLRPLYAGGISEARMIEQLTVFELNMAKLNGMRRLAPRFVSGEE